MKCRACPSYRLNYAGTASTINTTNIIYTADRNSTIYEHSQITAGYAVEQMEGLVIKSKRYDEINDVYWKLRKQREDWKRCIFSVHGVDVALEGLPCESIVYSN